MSIILGVDPGSRVTGYGLIAAEGSRCQYVASGCIRMTADDLVQRLQQIYAGLSEILSQYQPTFAAVEQVFFHQNPNSALKLGQARGAAIVAIGYYGITELAEYSARQIKQAVVGYGGAEKSQVQLMVKNLLRLSDVPQADAADALAIALCCAQHQRWSAVTDLKKEKIE